MNTVFINPGSGDVRAYGKSCLRDAWTNIRRFRRELGVADVRIVREPDKDEATGGRYAFRLTRGECLVDMPGLVLPATRFRLNTDDNPWNFPRLYVDGSSWLWPFAVDCAAEALTGKERGR